MGAGARCRGLIQAFGAMNDDATLAAHAASRLRAYPGLQPGDAEFAQLGRIAAAVPILLRRHGLRLMLQWLERDPPTGPARWYRVEVLERLDISRTLDLDPAASDHTALVTVAAACARHAEIVLIILKLLTEPDEGAHDDG